MNPPRDPPDPDPLARAVAAFQALPVPDRPPDAVVLARLAAGPEPAVEPPCRSRRKLVMRVASLSLAASVVVAAGGVLLFNASSGVALADVVRAAEKHKLVKYKWTATTEMNAPPGFTVHPKQFSHHAVHYADLRAPRHRHNDPDWLLNDGAIRCSGYTVIDYTVNRQLTVRTHVLTDPAAADDPEKAEERLREQVGPRPRLAELALPPSQDDANVRLTFLDQLRELQGKKDATRERDGHLIRYVIPGEAVVTTHSAEGVTTGRMAITTCLWVDPSTRLPVRMTWEQADRSPHENRNVYEMSDFEWDPRLPPGTKSDDLFNLKPPAGYALNDRTKSEAAKPAPAKP